MDCSFIVMCCWISLKPIEQQRSVTKKYLFEWHAKIKLPAFWFQKCCILFLCYLLKNQWSFSVKAMSTFMGISWWLVLWSVFDLDSPWSQSLYVKSCITILHKVVLWFCIRHCGRVKKYILFCMNRLFNNVRWCLISHKPFQSSELLFEKRHISKNPLILKKHQFERPLSTIIQMTVCDACCMRRRWSEGNDGCVVSLAAVAHGKRAHYNLLP